MPQLNKPNGSHPPSKAILLFGIADDGKPQAGLFPAAHADTSRAISGKWQSGPGRSPLRRRAATPKLSAVNPYAVHDHGQPARQRHDRLFHSAAPGDLHRPGLEPGPFL